MFELASTVHIQQFKYIIKLTSMMARPLFSMLNFLVVELRNFVTCSSNRNIIVVVFVTFLYFCCCLLVCLLLLLLSRCNRWAAQNKADKTVKKMQSNMEQEYVKKAYVDLEQQQHKFEHYHDRYNNHLQSLDVSTEVFGYLVKRRQLSTIELP